MTSSKAAVRGIRQQSAQSSRARKGCVEVRRVSDCGALEVVVCAWLCYIHRLARPSRPPRCRGGGRGRRHASELGSCTRDGASSSARCSRRGPSPRSGKLPSRRTLEHFHGRRRSETGGRGREQIEHSKHVQQFARSPEFVFTALRYPEKGHRRPDSFSTSIISLKVLAPPSERHAANVLVLHQKKAQTSREWWSPMNSKCNLTKMCMCSVLAPPNLERSSASAHLQRPMRAVPVRAVQPPPCTQRKQPGAPALSPAAPAADSGWPRRAPAAPVSASATESRPRVGDRGARRGSRVWGHRRVDERGGFRV